MKKPQMSGQLTAASSTEQENGLNLKKWMSQTLKESGV